MKGLRAMFCGAVIALATTGVAAAQGVVDMSRVTCEQMLRATPNSIDAAIWFSGYYNGRRKNTVLDLANFRNNAEIVVEECRSNPNRTLMQTVSALTSRGKQSAKKK
jgi:HdeA/HdeB family